MQDDPIAAKRCTRCRLVKPHEAFSINRAAHDGLATRCRECLAITQKERRTANPERFRAQRRAYYHKDPSRERARGNERQREWRAANPELHRAQVKAWKAANPEAAKEQAHVKQARRRAAGEPAWGPRREAERLIVLERDDGICGICGEDVDPLNYTLDHIIAIAAGGLHDLTNLQLAHGICNNRKYTR